jgi:hypothetical protein
MVGIAVCALAGCGGVRAADLFVVTRTAAAGRLTLLIDEEGGVSCSGRVATKLSDPELVQARAIQEELHDPAAAGLHLAPRPGSVYSYTVRDETGSVSFADNATGKPRVLNNLALFVAQVAQQSCHVSQ